MMTQELDLEDPLAIVTRLNADDDSTLIAALTDDEAQTLVDHLKAGADKYWAINPNRSLEMADSIIKIAEGRNNLSHKALGMMARGDALKLLGNSQEAWDELGESGEIFLQLGDEVGWARTRIGRLTLCMKLNQVSIALQDGNHAREIIQIAGKKDILLRLDFNMGCVYYLLGEPYPALMWYKSALSITTAEDQKFTGLIFLNMGAIHYDLLGDYKTARECYEYALELALMRHENKNIALARHNMAYIAIGQGQYSLALKLLYHVLDFFNEENLSFDANHVNQVIVECYLLLNRFSEAQKLALHVIDYFRTCSAAHDEAYTLLHLATAEAGLSYFEEAQAALNSAESIFASLGANTWMAITQLRRGQLAFKQHEIDTATSLAIVTVAFFKESEQQVHYATSILLLAQTHLVKKDLLAANSAALTALEIAKRTNIPLLRYSAHLLLGNIAEERKAIVHAIRRYRAANATIDRLQQGLTITLKSDFLEDKNEAFHALIRLHLCVNDGDEAFNALERAKSQAFFNYLTNRQLLRWPDNEPQSELLITELKQLRGEHHWWYQKAHNETKVAEQEPSSKVSIETALKELIIRERRMRSITEQLYLQNSANAVLLPATAPRLYDIQSSLDEKTLLIEFYHDGSQVWAFTVNKTTCHAYLLPTSIMKIERSINFLRFNLDTALSPEIDTVQHATLTKQIQYLLRQLYGDLLSPFVKNLQDYQRLIFVPYGSLHYLPFHLLYTGMGYLIQQYEVIILPAAGYVTQQGPERTGNATVIAHSLDGVLPHAVDEAQIVHTLFGGTLCVEGAASRLAFQEAPTQILHVATHAEYRQEQPDLSYIELADGQLFTDDLFQQDMSYELVTLSACETGRSQVTSSDELIGLGRGFLYAGAGALVASLWRVVDEVTPRLMEHFYCELYAGASKAAALRSAQLAILKDDPHMHPAFWGAFQLVGDPRPLSHIPA